MSEEVNINWHHFFLVLFIVVGTIIRFQNIGFQYTNWDENFTMNLASPAISAADVVATSLTADYTPPIYYLMAHLSMVLFGENPTAIRIPSAIMGSILIPVMFLVGREYKDELFGTLLAGFTTIYYNGYFYSRYGRSYAAELLFFSLLFYFFLRILKGDNRSGIWFGIMSVLCIWTHMYSAIPVGLLTIYLLWKRLPCGIGITTAGALLLGYFYVPLILQTRIAGVGSNTFGATPWEILVMTPVDIFGYSAIAVVLVVVWTLFKHRNDEVLAVVSLVSLATWASMFVLSFKTPIILHYSIFLVPMLLLAFIIPFWEQIKNRAWLMRYIFVALLVIVLETYQIYLLNFVQRLSM